jgi:hypothetical protein
VTPCARLHVVVHPDGSGETWTAERDRLAGFDLHVSGALLIYAADMPRTERHVVAVRSFGTWLALEVDQPPTEPQAPA